MCDYTKMTYGEKVLNSIYYLYKNLGLDFDMDTIMYMFFEGYIYREDTEDGSFVVYDYDGIHGKINVQNGEFIQTK